MRGAVAAVPVPTEKQVEALIAGVTAIQKQLEGFTISLTNAQRRATTKMRPGGEKIVAAVAKLAVERGLVLPEVNIDDMAASLELADRLRPLGDTTRALLRRLDDTITNAQSDCWWSATALYTMLSRVAAASPDLQAALQPATAFFARGKRRKGPATPVTPATPPAKSAA